MWKTKSALGVLTKSPDSFESVEEFKIRLKSYLDYSNSACKLVKAEQNDRSSMKYITHSYKIRGNCG